MKPENAVLSNLHDSVSRIVDNFQFTHIEAAAHSRLVSLVVEKLTAMSDTCRALLENSGRTGTGLNSDIDVKHLFRMHRVDLHDLVDYTQQVGAFPPRPIEIHGDERAEHYRQRRAKARQEKENLEKSMKKKKAKVLMRHPTPPIYSLPAYDAMSPSELGFNDDDSSSDLDISPPLFEAPPLPPPPPPPRIQLPYFLPPPPPPPPLPPLLESPVNDLYNIPSFDPQVPPPPYSNPEPVVKLKLFKADPPLPSEPPKEPREKWPKFERYRMPKKLPEKRKIESTVAPKMTKKRLMQTNYERRLRNEQMALEERKKEKILEMKMKQKEKERKWAEKKKVEVAPPRKFKERPPKKNLAMVVEELRKLKDVPPEDPIQPKIQMPQKDENGNHKLILKIPPSLLKSSSSSTKIQKSTSSESQNLQMTSSEVKEAPREKIVNRAPLTKIRVTYRNVWQGRFIKKVDSTEFIDVDGVWKPIVRTWTSKQGVFSKTNFPSRAYSQNGALSNSPIRFETSRISKIPKLKLTKNSDNTYSRRTALSGMI